MCQIIIDFDTSNIVNIFKNQEDRSGDGVGLLDINTGEITTYFSEYNLLNKDEAKFVKDTVGGPCIIHGRKASVGGKREELLHPFYNNKMALFHNGTLGKADKIKDFLKLFNGSSDTETIFNMIRNYDIYDEDFYENLTETLQNVNKSFTIGTIIIHNFLTQETYVYSDGARDLAVFYEDGKVKAIANYYNNDKESIRFNGYFLLDNKGKVIEYEGSIIDTDFEQAKIDILYEELQKKFGNKFEDIDEKIAEVLGDDWLYTSIDEADVDVLKEFEYITKENKYEDIEEPVKPVTTYSNNIKTFYNGKFIM